MYFLSVNWRSQRLEIIKRICRCTVLLFLKKVYMLKDLNNNTKTTIRKSIAGFIVKYNLMKDILPSNKFFKFNRALPC